MNGQSMCREAMNNGRKCGLTHGHAGPHQCCSIHAPRPTAPSWERS